jgi:restriction system protein
MLTAFIVIIAIGAIFYKLSSNIESKHDRILRTYRPQNPPTDILHDLYRKHSDTPHYPYPPVDIISSLNGGQSRTAHYSHQQKQEHQTWTLELLKSLEWKRYEELCVEYLIEKGCKAKVTPLGADGGIDIKVFGQDSERPITIGQCKAWGSRKVKVDHVRALFGVMAAEQVPHGIYLTTSDFTSEARAFAEGKNLQLITGAGLIDLIRELSEESQQRLMELATRGDYTTPTCARCGTKMVLRKSKKDQSQFWGCLNYPRCRMTINLRNQSA